MPHHTTEEWLKNNPNALSGFSLKGKSSVTTAKKPQPKAKTSPYNIGSEKMSKTEDAYIPGMDANINVAREPSRPGKMYDFIGPYYQPTDEKFVIPEDMSDPERYVPTREELVMLNEYGLLFDPNTDMPMYPLTNADPKLIREMRGLGNPMLQSAGLAASVFFGASEEFGKQARFAIEHELTGGGSLYSEEEQAKFKERLAKKEAELGRQLDLYEYRVLFDETFDVPGFETPLGRISTRSPLELAAELLIPGTVVDNVIGAGIGLSAKSAFRGFKTVGGEAYNGLRKGNVVGATPDVPQIIKPPENNLFNLPEVKTTLTKQETLFNSLKEMLPQRFRPTEYDDVIRQISNISADITERSKSLAKSMSLNFEHKVKEVFILNEKGQVTNIGIPTVDGFAPTIADIAANYAYFRPFLREGQQKAMDEMKERIAPIKAMLDELGLSVGTRFDIKEGGFYIPRGRAYTPDEIEGKVIPTGKQSSYDEQASQTSETAGIENRELTYVPMRDAMEDFIVSVGRDVEGAYTAKIVKELRDPDGNLIASTAKERIENLAVWQKAEKLKKKAKATRERLLKLMVRNATLAKVAKTSARKAEKESERLRRELERVAEADDYLPGGAEREARERTAKAQGRFDEFSGAYNAADLKLARKHSRDAITDAKNIGIKIRANYDEIRKITRKLKGSDAKLYQATLRLLKSLEEDTKLLETIEIAADAGADVGTEYQRILRQIDKVENQSDKLFDEYDKLVERLEIAQQKKSDLSDSAKLIRQESSEAVNNAQAFAKAERKERQLRREVELAKREEARLSKLSDVLSDREVARLQKEIKKVHGDAADVNANSIRALFNLYKGKVAKSNIDLEFEEIAEQYTKEVDEARKGPRTHVTGIEAQIGIPQLNGTSLPAVLTQKIKKIADADMRLKGKGSEVFQLIQWHNQLWRSLRATLDISAPGIHGLLASFNNPVIAARALGWQFRAWGIGGQDLLGKHMSDFNTRASSKNLLNTDQWSNQGLHLGGADTEFTIGQQKFTEGLAKSPGVKQANRAFGYYGDYLRLEMAQDMAEQYLREGRTIDEIMNGELGRQISDAVNNATGYAGKRFGGNLGELLLFAPRFFQARINNITRAARATVKDPVGAASELLMVPTNTGGKLTPQERMARRSIMRMISQGTLLTVGINEALGNETDFRLLVEDKNGVWRYNSNFMRIRFANRDWSIFGTYDSMLRLLVATGAGVYQQDASVLNGLRGIASGTVSLAWDLVSGETFDQMEPKAGWAATDTGYMPIDSITPKVGYILESHIPFSVDEAPEVHNMIRSGDVKGGISLLAGETFGLKSAPLSYKDLQSEIIKELKEKGVKSPTQSFSQNESVNGAGWDIDNLSEAEKDIINKDPRMVEKIEEYKLQKPDELTEAFSRLKADQQRAEIDLLEAMKGANGGVIRDAINALKTERRNLYDNFEDNNKELLAESRGKDVDKNVADQHAQKYFNVELETHGQSGFMDWEKFNADREKILEEAKADNPAYVEYITGTGLGTFRGEQYQDPKVRKIIESYESDREEMREYFDVAQRVVDYYGEGTLWREYLKSGDTVRFKSRKENIDNGKAQKILDLEREITKQKEYIRLTNPKLEALLYKWGFVQTPMNNLVERMVKTLDMESPDRQVGSLEIQKLIDRVFVGGNN